MKRTVFIFALMISAGIIANGQTVQKDFRGFAWGSLLSQVKTTEKAKFLSQNKDDELTFLDQLAGSDVNVIYQFNDNDKLVSGEYFFTKTYFNPQLYLQDYFKFRNLLNTKYGNFRISNEDWKANTTPNDRENYGQAVHDEYLTLFTSWVNERSNIKIILTSMENHPSLQIHYTAKSLDELEIKEELLKALSKL
jgi:hypothetical protein